MKQGVKGDLLNCEEFNIYRTPKIIVIILTFVYSSLFLGFNVSTIFDLVMFTIPIQFQLSLRKDK